MSDLKPYAHYLTVYSADWWDDPGGFYPIYLTAEQIKQALPRHAEKELRDSGNWPPPEQGITLLGGGEAKAGDARSEWVQPIYTLAFDLPGAPVGTQIKLGRKRGE